MSIPTEVRDYIAYDAATGKFHWTKTKGCRSAGDEAGCVNNRGYVVVSFGRQKLFGHRLAWFLMTGSQPPALIDHKDGDPANNVWVNLRAADKSQNGANRKAQRPIGKGILARPDGRFAAQICVRGRHKHLGTFATIEAASAAYEAAAREGFGEFARAA